MYAVAAAEGDRAEVEVPVVVDVGEVGAEHAPGLAVGRQAVVPGCPVPAGAVAEGDLEQLVAEVGSGVIVVHAVADVHQAVVVDVAEGDPAIAEVPVLEHRPVSGPVAEPDHDPVLLRVDVGRAVVADGDDVHVAVAVHIAELELGVAALHLRGLQAPGAIDVIQLGMGR